MMAPIHLALGVLLLIVGLIAAITHGGWAWLTPLIGLALAGVGALVLHREPVAGGPRRRLRDRGHPPG